MHDIKVALITSGNPNDTKGIMNFVQEKVIRLQQQNNITLDIFIIRRRDSLLFSILRRKKRPKRNIKANISGTEYRNLWIKNGFFNQF